MRSLSRHITRERDAVHDPAMAVIVVHGIVLGAAIVPQRDRARLSAKAAGEFGPYRVLEQIAYQRRAFLNAHVGEAQRVSAIDVERLAAGLGMRAHDRMLGHVFLLRLALA